MINVLSVVVVVLLLPLHDSSLDTAVRKSPTSPHTLERFKIVEGGKSVDLHTQGTGKEINNSKTLFSYYKLKVYIVKIRFES